MGDILSTLGKVLHDLAGLDEVQKGKIDAGCDYEIA